MERAGRGKIPEGCPGSTAAILGGVLLGLSIAQVARSRGARVTVTDIYPTPLVCAEELGLGPCLDVSEMETAQVTEVLGDAGGEHGYIAVFDTTGRAETLQQGLSCLDRGGTLVAMAGVPEGFCPEEGALAGERRLVTCSNNFEADYQEGLDLLKGGTVQVEPMITHRFPLVEAKKAFETARNKHETGALKVLLLP